MKFIQKRWFLLAGALLFSPAFAGQNDTGVSIPKVGIANPASVNCIDKGGSLQLRQAADGGSYGVCVFKGGRECEEWAMFRGECPVGGLPVKRKAKKP